MAIESVVKSRQHPLCKLVRALHTSKGRKQHALFVAEGGNAVAAALRARWPLREVLVPPDDLGREWQQLASDAGVATRFVDSDLFEYLSEAQTAPEVIALAQLPGIETRDASALHEALTGQNPSSQNAAMPLPNDDLTLLLDGIADPGNVGTLLRSADAAGAARVALSAHSADAFGPKAVRASAGSVFQLPVFADEADALSDALQRAKVPLIVAVAHGGEDCFAMRWPRGCALVLGHETRGVSPELEAAATARVTIPIYGRAESLNVAAAGAVLLYAWRASLAR
jgi:TrmH family RNA methyltransferase